MRIGSKMDDMNQSKIKYVSVALASGRKITYSHDVDKVASWGVTDTGNLFISNEKEDVIAVFSAITWEMLEVTHYAA